MWTRWAGDAMSLPLPLSPLPDPQTTRLPDFQTSTLPDHQTSSSFWWGKNLFICRCQKLQYLIECLCRGCDLAGTHIAIYIYVHISYCGGGACGKVNLVSILLPWRPCWEKVIRWLWHVSGIAAIKWGIKEVFVAGANVVSQTKLIQTRRNLQGWDIDGRWFGPKSKDTDKIHQRSLRCWLVKFRCLFFFSIAQSNCCIAMRKSIWNYPTAHFVWGFPLGGLVSWWQSGRW